jgi:hypothetical protein
MGGRLPMPGTLSGQGEELKNINGKLYDYLQILLWVGMNNYDSYGDGDDRSKGWDSGNRDLENRKLVNGKPRNGKLEKRNGNPGSGMPRNKEIGKLALGGCLEK